MADFTFSRAECFPVELFNASQHRSVFGEINSECYPSAAIGCPALGFSPSSTRNSYTALEALLWLLRMAKVERPKETCSTQTVAAQTWLKVATNLETTSE